MNIPGGVIIETSRYEGEGVSTSTVHVPALVVARRWKVEDIAEHEDAETGETVEAYEWWTVEVGLVQDHEVNEVNQVYRADQLAKSMATAGWRDGGTAGWHTEQRTLATQWCHADGPLPVVPGVD